jgi:CubicO group peptidase (beta-lactamase class C family)
MCPIATVASSKRRRQWCYDGVAFGLIDGKEQKTWFSASSHALNERSAFEIGAVTEVFTGILLAQAVLYGKLRLTDPIGGLLPAEFPWADPEFAATPVVALATQTSGLPATPANLFAADPEDAYADYTESDLLAFLANYRPHEWKRDYAYSPLNGALLCVLLGKLYENGCTTLLISKVLDPLGLPKTGLRSGERARPCLWSRRAPLAPKGQREPGCVRPGICWRSSA